MHSGFHVDCVNKFKLEISRYFWKLPHILPHICVESRMNQEHECVQMYYEWMTCKRVQNQNNAEKNHAKKFAKKMICNAEFDNKKEKNKGEEEKKI